MRRRKNTRNDNNELPGLKSDKKPLKKSVIGILEFTKRSKNTKRSVITNLSFDESYGRLYMSQNQLLNNLFNEDVEQKPDTIFRQYQLYVEMADHVSSRRAIANGFYLTATSILVVVMGVIVQAQLFIYMILFSLIGIIIAVFWIFLIRQYKNLNGAKFQVINKIEEKLPVKGYSTEWDLLSQGRKRRIYWPLTHVEILVPSFLIIVYIFLLAISIYNLIFY